MKTYCLNLHERYAPDWGVWECARELYANAKDACPDGLTLKSPDANTLEIWTPTIPDLSQLFIIGCGSKTAEDENIGQFGEGVKLTALASTRRAGDSLTIRLPRETISFEIREHLGERVLFAVVKKSRPFKGCLCKLVMQGAGYALNGKVITGDESHMIPKPPEAPVQIFSKGVWICNLDEDKAIYSYNLNDIKLNRDRSYAEPWSVRSAVGYTLLANMTPEVADQLVTRPLSWEAHSCLSTVGYSATEEQKQLLADSLAQRYGKQMVMRTDARASEVAERRGHNPILLGDGLAFLVRNHVKKDVDVAGAAFALDEVPALPEWEKAHEELLLLAHYIDIPLTAIRTFADVRSDLLGKADLENSAIWLNERLWHKDNRFERVRTFIHEAAHLQAGALDATMAFENSLDLLGGKLALLVLDNELTGHADRAIIDNSNGYQGTDT
jgi:hypothetical protein